MGPVNIKKWVGLMSILPLYRYIKDAEFIYQQFTTGNKYKKKMEEMAKETRKNKTLPKFRTMLS